MKSFDLNDPTKSRNQIKRPGAPDCIRSLSEVTKFKKRKREAKQSVVSLKSLDCNINAATVYW